MSQVEAEAFTDFPLFWVGESYGGYNLQMIVRNAYTPSNEALAYEAMDSFVFIYGECVIPEGGSACSPPLTLSIEPVCLKPPSSFPQWADAMESVRGEALLLRSGDEQVRLWTGDVSIRVSLGGDSALVDQIIRDLWGLNHGAQAGQPLPPPDLSGCQEE